MTVRYWHSPDGIAFLNEQTGDGRILSEIRRDPDATDHGPLRVAWEDWGGHGGAVEVGRATSLTSSESAVRSEGYVDDETRDGAEVIRRGDADPPWPLTVSVDLDDVDLEVYGPPMGDDEEPILAGSFSFPEAQAVTDTAGRVHVRVPGARDALTAAGLTAVVAAAGEGLPDDHELWFSEPSDEIVVRMAGRFRGLTLVDIPAFDRAAIVLRPDGWTPDGQGAEADGDALTAAVVGSLDLPIAERDADWDGDGAKDRVFDLCTDGDTVDEACVSRAFLWRDDDADPQTQAAYSLGYADVVNDQVQIVPQGVFATAGSRGVDALEGVSEEDRDRLRARVCGLYELLASHFEDDEIVCPFDDDDAASEAGTVTVQAGAVSIDVPEDADPDEVGRQAAAGFLRTLEQRKTGGCGCGGTCGGGCDHRDTAAVTAASGGRVPTDPPRAWFNNPGFGPNDVTTVDDPETGRRLSGVPMHYDETTGQVWGHIALWGQCHTGSPSGQCVMTPRSRSGYQWFHHGQVKTAEGELLPVGVLTMGGGHADTRLSYRAALEHYDDVATQVAQVRAGEDDYGVWVAGALLPDVAGDELEMRKLRGSSPSGDWRWIGGSHELSIAHAVNGPGFPVPRAKVAAGGEILSLVAAGAREVALVADAADEATAAAVSLDGDTVQRMIAQGVRDGIDAWTARQRLEADAVQARQSLQDRRRRRAAARLRR